MILRLVAFISERVENLFIDSEAWPSKRAAYYLGILPILVPPQHANSTVHRRIAQNAHTVSIQLAGRIWGDVRRRNIPRNKINNPSLTSHPQKIMMLPAHLAQIIPNPSYPTFSLNYL